MSITVAAVATKATVHAAELHPVAVGALVDAVERGAARGMGLKRVRRQLVARHLGMVQQGSSHQGRFHVSTEACLLSGQQGGGNALRREERRPHAREGMDHVYGGRTKAWLRCQDTQACQHKVLDGRLVLQRTLLAVGSDGAVYETRVEP